MNKICRDIFKAIHEGKWLQIEYKNKGDEITKFWIGILDLDIASNTLIVDGLHIGKYTLGNGYRISIDRILSSQVVEGSYCEINKKFRKPLQNGLHFGVSVLYYTRIMRNYAKIS